MSEITKVPTKGPSTEQRPSVPTSPLKLTVKSEGGPPSLWLPPGRGSLFGQCIMEKDAKCQFLGNGAGCSDLCHRILSNTFSPFLSASLRWAFTAVSYSAACLLSPGEDLGRAPKGIKRAMRHNYAVNSWHLQTRDGLAPPVLLATESAGQVVG